MREIPGLLTKPRFSLTNAAMIVRMETTKAPAKFTEIDRINYADAAHDIAFAVAAGLTPRPEDVAKYRRLTNKRDAYLGVEQSFPARG